VHRDIDPAPVESTRTTPLASGILEASFVLNTGADQAASRPFDAGLVLWVAFGTRQFRQQFASCKDAGHGDALSDGSSALDWAECDGRIYSLHVSDTRVEVHDDASHAVVAAIPIPRGLRLATAQP
jgi:hypothetical protein